MLIAAKPVEITETESAAPTQLGINQINLYPEARVWGVSRQAFTNRNQPEVKYLSVNYPADFDTIRKWNFFQYKIPSKRKYESSSWYSLTTLWGWSFKLVLLPTNIKAFIRFFIWVTHTEQLLWQLLEAACTSCLEIKSSIYLGTENHTLFKTIHHRV